MRYAAVALARITRPPMVGVPRFTWCVVGPSSRIG